MKVNKVGQRGFHFWKPKESALPRKTPRLQSHVKMCHLTLPSVDTMIIIPHFPHITPQMSVKITQTLKAAMGSQTILKSQERARVSLCHSKLQRIPSWTCLYLYRLKTAWRKLQVLKRKATLLWRKAPRLHSYQQLTSKTCPQQVCLHFPHVFHMYALCITYSLL